VRSRSYFAGGTIQKNTPRPNDEHAHGFGTRKARLDYVVTEMFKLLQNPKELYPIDKVDVAEAWFMVPVSKRIVEFQQSLAKEPPIRLGTPDPYVPGHR